MNITVIGTVTYEKKKKNTPVEMCWGIFLCNRKFRWNSLLHKKPYRAGAHCGGEADMNKKIL